MEHFGGEFAVVGDAGVIEEGLDFFRDSGGHIIGTTGHGHLMERVVKFVHDRGRSGRDATGLYFKWACDILDTLHTRA
jgi:hypothetical protein